MATIAITVSNSNNVKPRKDFFVITEQLRRDDSHFDTRVKAKFDRGGGRLLDKTTPSLCM